MTDEHQKRRLIDAIHEQNLERDRLFQLVAALANCLDRDVVVDIMHSHLGIEPVDDGDSTVFDDIVVKFDANGRVTSIYRIIDGSGCEGLETP